MCISLTSITSRTRNDSGCAFPSQDQKTKSGLRPGATARKMSLIVMDLIKSTLETIYDRMKSNVDEAFIKAVMDEMKSYAMTSPSGEQASLETNQSTQESNETQIVGRFFAKYRADGGQSWSAASC